MMIQRLPFLALGLGLLLLGCHHEAGHDHGHEHSAHATSDAAVFAPGQPASPDGPPAGVNAVQNEMRLLNDAMRDATTAIAFGNLGALPAGFHRVHKAKGFTEAALEKGEYRLPKNADKVAEFKRTDEAFHGELEKLLAAAGTNDVKATAAQLGVVVSKCNGCHSEFRQ